MAIEIERKFLVKKELWEKTDKPNPEFYRQGYLYSDEFKTIRIRIANDTAWLTIKGKTAGVSRTEFEYEIPAQEAKEMLDSMTESSIEKYRYKIEAAGKLWEVDDFKGANEGLLMAEIELESESEIFLLPDWAGEEVTEDSRYYNATLVKKPYSKW